MALILFPINEYNHFHICPPEVLDGEISRTAIRLRLQNRHTGEDRHLYQAELDRLNALKYISRLRKGQLSPEDFHLKVQLYSL